MGKRGRPPKDEASKRGVQVSFRVTQELRGRLEAARAEGEPKRSLSQEIELRLRRSFELDREIKERFGGPSLYWIFRIIADDIRIIETLADAKWFESRFAYDEIKCYLEVVLGRLRRPRGRYRLPRQWVMSERHFPPGAWGRGVARQSLFMLETALRDPNALDRMPRARCAVDPFEASSPLAGKLAEPPASERRARKRVQRIVAETEQRLLAKRRATHG